MKMLHIARWMCLLIAVCLTACSSDETNSQTQEDCFLNIYVYVPGRPIVTRGSTGEIAPSSAEETKVNTLQLWVFRHDDASLVGYLDTIPTFLNETVGQEKYQIKVDRTFADNPENVDVYVVANTASCNLSFDRNTTRDMLDAAKFGVNGPDDYFGVTAPLVSSIPEKGLPMSAVQKNQPVYGRFPTLRLGTESEMTTLQLTRAVSKLRFVLCRITEKESAEKKLVNIDEISLNGNQIPVETYIIPRQDYSFSYDGRAVSYGAVAKEQIPQVENPMDYAYETQQAQDYEDMIDNAVNAVPSQLKQIGLTYLRESDKQLKGIIRYTYTNEQNGVTELKTVTTDFSMAAPGDFLRNHSWIVYIYFMDAEIHVLTVTNIGMKAWTADGQDEDVTEYNW